MPSIARSGRTLVATASLAAVTVLLFWQYVSRYGLTPNTPVIVGPFTRLPSADKLGPTVVMAGNDLASGPRTSRGDRPHTTKPQPAVLPSTVSATIVATAASTSTPSVTLPQGKYTGAIIPVGTLYPKPLEVFRGIPYAQDTAGENRFRLPVPLARSQDTFNATQFGDVCPNIYQRLDATEGENCLNLNLYRPAGIDYSNARKTQALKMPVVVYFHGGAFNSGAGLERNMGSFVAWADSPLIGINFNYRVGALGFLPSALTAREGLLNLGLRDQQALLAWVQSNVLEFGGDPENVSIMGLSAGAHSVGHQLMYYSQASEPAPFTKAIMESGATTARAVFHPTHPRHLIQFREFLIAAQIEGVAEEDLLDALRAMPLAQVVNASRSVWKKYESAVLWPFQPVIDGPNSLANSSQPVNETALSFLPAIPDLPINSWRRGTHLRIPVLTGFNTNEGAMFVPARADTNADFRAFFKGLIPSLTPADLDSLERLYPDPAVDSDSPYVIVPPGRGKQWARLDAAYSHYAYICPVLQTAHFLSGPPANENDTHPLVYLYHFAATSTNGVANHGDEAPLVAYNMAVIGGKEMPGLRDTADAMHGAWVRFAVFGNPNPAPGSKTGDLGDHDDHKPVTWPPFRSPFLSESSIAGGQMMLFGQGNDERRGPRGRRSPGVPAQVTTLSERERAACRFWWDRVELSEGLGKREQGNETQGRTGSVRAKL